MSDYSPEERKAIMDEMAKVEGRGKIKSTLISSPVVAAQAPLANAYTLSTVGATVYPSVATPAIATTQTPPITGPKVAQAEADIRGVSQSPQKIQVTMPPQKSGRDVADRGIANIVTGGMAN